MEQFRIDEQTGSVYELNSRGDAYLFVGKLLTYRRCVFY